MEQYEIALRCSMLNKQTKTFPLHGKQRQAVAPRSSKRSLMHSVGAPHGPAGWPAVASPAAPPPPTPPSNPGIARDTAAGVDAPLRLLVVVLIAVVGPGPRRVRRPTFA
eukprot:scaffold624773_cov22-Prasinocladus_malaysianus.AAC.1